jgi:hypothetical protein
MAAQSESRMRNDRWARRLVVIATTLLSTFITFRILVYLMRPGWESHEYSAIVVWTVPLSFLVLLFGKLSRRWFARPTTIVRIAGSIFLALVCAVVWTYLAVVLTGGYALAFDANPLFCWGVGSVAGSLLNTQWQARAALSAKTSVAAI